MITTFTYRPSLVKVDARNFELSWQQTHKQTHKQTGPILQYTAPLSLMRRVKIMQKGLMSQRNRTSLHILQKRSYTHDL